MMAQNVLGDGVKRTTGNDARRYNLLAGRLMAELVKGLLGPRGMDKVFFESSWFRKPIYKGIVVFSKTGIVWVHISQYPATQARSLVDVTLS